MAVGQGLLMSLQFLKHLKILNRILCDLLLKLFDQLNKIVFLLYGNDGLLVQNIIHKLIHIGVLIKHQKVQRLNVNLSIRLLVL